MATDFTNNNRTISTTGGFLPNTTNTPIDVRTRVNSKADIANIPMPFIGMRILVLQDESNNGEITEYIVKSLKTDSLGVANSVIDEVELTKDFLGVPDEVDLSNYATLDDVPTKISELTNDSGFLTGTEVDNKIANAQLSGGNVDLSGYATKDELNAKADKTEIANLDIPTKTSELTNDSGFLTNIPSEYVTETELTAKGYATQTDVNTTLNNKVDVVAGKGLSTNDFTNDLKTKLDGIASGAEVNVQSDWNVTDTTSDAYILNKPDLTTYATKTFVSDEVAKAVTGGTVDLSGYAKVDDVGDKTNLTTTEKTTIVGAINEISDKAKANATSIATKANQTDVTALGTRVDALESLNAEENVQADWNVVDTSNDAFIKNKPDLTLKADKTYVNTELAKKVDAEVGKSLVPDTEIAKIHTHDNKMVLDNLTQTVVDDSHKHTNKTILDTITQDKIDGWNKAEENVQSDWNETNTTSDAYIKNKPNLSELGADLSLKGSTLKLKNTDGDEIGVGVELPSNYVTNEVGNASQITFSDGETIQTKLDSDSLKGEDGVGIASIVNYYRASSLSSGVTKDTPVTTTSLSLDEYEISYSSDSDYGWTRYLYYDSNKNFLGYGGSSNPIAWVSVADVKSLDTSKSAVYFRMSVNIPVRFSMSNNYPIIQGQYGYETDGSVGTTRVTETHISTYIPFADVDGATVRWVYNINNDTDLPTYTITNNLTNCTNSNTNTDIEDGSSYSATITANSGYALDSITVTMGGADITSSSVSGNVITISSVTGDIVITATTIVDASNYSITNNLTNCTNSNTNTNIREGSSYNATITANNGYKMSNITVTMGGADITSSSVSGNVITINNVTGNIVITANAIVDTSDEQWTTTVQTITSTKRYLWNYVVITLTDGSKVETEPCVIGVHGGTSSSSSGGSSSSVSVFVNNNTYTPNNDIISLPNYITFPKGKKITILGDSITYGYDGTDASLVSKPYPLLVKELLGASSVYNYGMSGSTIGGGGSGTTYKGSTPMNIRYADMLDADYVLVLGGVNDYCASTIPLGTKGDSTNQTFYGALKILIEGLITKYPLGRIGFMTPLRKQGDTTTNNQGSTLKEYRNAIIEMCEDYCIPVLDLYTKGGCHPENATWRTNNLPDGLHPNQSYYEKLARQIASFILSL